MAKNRLADDRNWFELGSFDMRSIGFELVLKKVQNFFYKHNCSCVQIAVRAKGQGPWPGDMVCE